MDKLEVGENRIAQNAPRCAAVEALRGDTGWSSFGERHKKATSRYKIGLERMITRDWRERCICGAREQMDLELHEND